ncbi:hypothetical protein [Roseomonas fluvialis]|uniref:Uncharacterized protein n=1 Tax=Roseomonas fluvialis TaxID=1750527 RepID=A0ABN6P5W9_9PROT|nr:hypothetical protein [Roseomonas fluvialis]BDG74053.1 hypothetical protein Rmf_39820 [Roseomonas fluvialis]
MDAAVAAAMSDADRNPNFRRKWVDDARVTAISGTAPPAAIGSFGLVLQEALARAGRPHLQSHVGSADRRIQPPEGTENG